jgi:hypothetical protein
MKTFTTLMFWGAVLSALPGAVALEAPPIEWQVCHGTTTYHEQLTSMAPTADGGYLLGGFTSDLDDGFLDWFVVRVDAFGQALWSRTLGGSDEDELESLAQTPDGGFILGGTSSSPIDGTKTSPYLGGLGDCWVVRLDAAGEVLWDRTYGGPGRERLWTIRPTGDGGFVFCGDSSSDIGPLKSAPFHGGISDFWVVRLDEAGELLWDFSSGGPGEDSAVDVRETADGGLVVVGSSDSPAGLLKWEDSFGDLDFWILRLGSDGQPLWNRTYGGTLRDFAKRVVVMPEGGFAVLGGSWSGADGNKLTTNHTSGPVTTDYWLLRLDESGSRLWESSLGGPSEDIPSSFQRTTDGGFILGGYSLSGEGGTKSSSSLGSFDYWVVRTDATGRRLWDGTYGGRERDRLHAMAQSEDGGFVLAGYSNSGLSGNKTAPNLYGEDFWILKLAPDALTTRPRLRWERCCQDDDGPKFALYLSGTPGLTYRIEFSDDLATWNRLREVVATTGEVAIFASSVRFQPIRYFRAVLVP